MATGQVKLYLKEEGLVSSIVLMRKAQWSGERELDQAPYAVQPEFELGLCIDLMRKGVLDKSGTATRPPRSQAHDPDAHFP